MRFSQYLFGGIFLLFLIGIASLAIKKKMGHDFQTPAVVTQEHTVKAPIDPTSTTIVTQTPQK
jgi:hypothetical protein